MSVQVLCPFFNWVVCLPGVELCEFFIYFGEQTCVQGIICKYIFSYGWLPFHFADVFFSRAEAFYSLNRPSTLFPQGLFSCCSFCWISRFTLSHPSVLCLKVPFSVSLSYLKFKYPQPPPTYHTLFLMFFSLAFITI